LEDEKFIMRVCAITLGVVLILLVLAVLHRVHLQKISRQISDLPPNPEGTERILDAIEGARLQISSTGDELRGQTRTVKERVNWLIGRVDALIATIANFVRGVP
jgi:predicted PurR-regulated permease PerM